MTTDQPNDTPSDDQLQQGLLLLKAGNYWEAHEAWEDLWLSLPDESAARRATKALIQLAAICYKPEQAAAGRSEPGMQRGMARLLETSQRHLDDSFELAAPKPQWDRAMLQQALEQLDAVHTRWSDGDDLATIRDAVSTLVDDFAPLS